tara:strand:- start:75570 stop:76013 length:444 start_codon:yes stop_codon:yes gene_type:complete
MKKLALYAAVGYGIYYFFGKGKAAYAAYKNLKTQVVSARNLKPGIENFNLDVDVILKNEGQEPINLNTNGLATLKRVNLFSANGTLIGYSTPGAITLDIPPGGQQLIKNIPTIIKTAYVLEALQNIDNVKNVSTTIDIEIGGQTITV